MNNIKLHIVLDMLIMITFLSVVVYIGTISSVLYLVFSLPLALFYFCKIVYWIFVLADVLFSKPIKITTKSYRYSYREKIYFYLPQSRYFYSIVLFDDIRMRGKYVYFGYPTFHHGEMLTIIYYPKSKYIKSIERFELPDNG